MQKIKYYDDLTGKLIEDEDFQPTRIIVNDEAYELDLDEDSFAQLQKALKKYIAVAREVKAPQNAVTRRPNPETKRMRDWAKENGLDVSDRGRLAPEIIAAYRKKDPSIATSFYKAQQEDPDAAREDLDVDLDEL